MFRSACRLALFLTCAACATPQERCILDATKELRTVNALIAETQANLARGYAIDRVTETRPRLTFCGGHYHRHVGVAFCTDDYTIVRDRPVAIDPEAERRKLAILQERKKRLEASARNDIAACRGTL